MTHKRPASGARMGIDLGGTKIAGALLNSNNKIISESRIPSPRNDYQATLEAIRYLVDELEGNNGQAQSIGMGIPGSIHPKTELVQNANSTWLNDKPLRNDISALLKRDIAIANDANCFALSEAIDGAGAQAKTVFGVILGTGCGGAFVQDKKLLKTTLSISGEWGHTPLPWPEPDEYPGSKCWCGKHGCMESWVSGPALEQDYENLTGTHKSCADLATAANNGDIEAKRVIDRHLDRLARGLSTVINILDPELIVLGGGLSQMNHLYEELPNKILPHIFSSKPEVKIKPPKYGDASGVRGAAWLPENAFQ